MSGVYEIMLAAWFVSFFFARFGLHYSLGYLFVCSFCRNWDEFGAFSVLLVVAALFKELRRATEK